MNIRSARIEDAPVVALVHVRSWQTAYRGLVPQEYLDALEVARRRVVWISIVAQTDWPQTGTLVAEREQGVIAFVNVRPTRDDDEDPAHVGEVAAIYALPGIWGQGVGQGLMAAALDSLARAGFGQATLWVLDTNTRARRFYEAGGWRTDGAAKRDDRRGFPLREVRYRRPLPEAPP